MLLISTTIGTSIEERLAEYKAGKMSEAYALDACTTTYMAKTATFAMSRVEESYHHDLPDIKGKTHCNFCSLQTTCPMSQAV